MAACDNGTLGDCWHHGVSNFLPFIRRVLPERRLCGREMCLRLMVSGAMSPLPRHQCPMSTHLRECLLSLLYRGLVPGFVPDLQVGGCTL